MKLYHGTSKRHLEKVLKHGLKPRGQRKGNWDHSVLSHPGAVYMTSAYSLYYALSATKAADVHEQGVVFEIDTTKLNPFCLCPDEDFLAQATHSRPQFDGKTLYEVTAFYRDQLEDYSDNWEMSVKHMGNCCYLGTIPVDAITRYALIGNPIAWLRWSDPTIGIMNFAVLGNYYRALSKSLFGDATDYVDDGNDFYKLPDQEQLATVTVVDLRKVTAA